MSVVYRLALLAALLPIATTALAHHSFSAVYDQGRLVSASGVVTSFRLVNPHAMLTLDVTDEAGNVTPWTVEFDGRLNMTVYGWTPETIRVGERVSITGNPTHSGSARMFFAFLERADGSVLRRPAMARVDALERERRERALARDADNAGAAK